MVLESRKTRPSQPLPFSQWSPFWLSLPFPPPPPITNISGALIGQDGTICKIRGCPGNGLQGAVLIVSRRTAGCWESRAGVGRGCGKEAPPVWLEVPSRTQVLARPFWSHCHALASAVLEGSGAGGAAWWLTWTWGPKWSAPSADPLWSGVLLRICTQRLREEELVSGCNAEGKNEDTETRPPARPEAQDSHGRGRGDLLLFCWNPVTKCPPLIPQPTDCNLINSLPGVSSVDAQPVHSVFILRSPRLDFQKASVRPGSVGAPSPPNGQS